MRKPTSFFRSLPEFNMSPRLNWITESKKKRQDYQCDCNCDQYNTGDWTNTVEMYTNYTDNSDWQGATNRKKDSILNEAVNEWSHHLQTEEEVDCQLLCRFIPRKSLARRRHKCQMGDEATIKTITHLSLVFFVRTIIDIHYFSAGCVALFPWLLSRYSDSLAFSLSSWFSRIPDDYRCISLSLHVMFKTDIPVLLPLDCNALCDRRKWSSKLGGNREIALCFTDRFSALPVPRGSFWMIPRGLLSCLTSSHVSLILSHMEWMKSGILCYACLGIRSPGV